MELEGDLQDVLGVYMSNYCFGEGLGVGVVGQQFGVVGFVVGEYLYGEYLFRIFFV